MGYSSNTSVEIIIFSQINPLDHRIAWRSGIIQTYHNYMKDTLLVGGFNPVEKY